MHQNRDAAPKRVETPVTQNHASHRIEHARAFGDREDRRAKFMKLIGLRGKGRG